MTTLATTVNQRQRTQGSLLNGEARLLQIMRQLEFGRIENLTVRAGEPIFNPPPKISRDIKFGSDSDSNQEPPNDDFLLKIHVNELFDHLERIGDGSVAVIEVKHGLPFRLVFEQTV